MDESFSGQGTLFEAEQATSYHEVEFPSVDIDEATVSAPNPEELARRQLADSQTAWDREYRLFEQGQGSAPSEARPEASVEVEAEEMPDRDDLEGRMLRLRGKVNPFFAIKPGREPASSFQNRHPKR